MTDPLPPPEELDLIAAELALGLLEAEDRAFALRQMLADPEFATRVAIWRERLTMIVEDGDSQMPPVDVWSRIEAGLGSGHSPEPVVDHADGGARRWKLTAFASSAVAVGLLALMIARPDSAPRVQPAPASTENAIAQINGPEGEFVVTSRYTPDTQILSVAVEGLEADELAPELWLIPSDGRPRSLGLIDPKREIVIRLGPGMADLIREGAVMAVTMEPREDAPHEAPSGEILGSAKVIIL